MYKYFLGRRSNLKTKRKNEPTVISASGEIHTIINSWLEKYDMDLDFFLEKIVYVVKDEIKKIEKDNDRELVLILSNNQAVLLNLLDEKRPKCEILIEDREYVISFDDKHPIEAYFGFVGDINIQIDFKKNFIQMIREKTSIGIQFEELDDEISEAVKLNCLELSEWENIASIMVWMEKLPVVIPAYEFTITIFEEESYNISKVYVINNRVFTFHQSNVTGEFEVEHTGNWNAEHDIFNYRYNT